MTHDIKLPPIGFKRLQGGQPFVLTPKEANFTKGDLLTVREHHPHANRDTGRTLTYAITDIQEGTTENGIQRGFVLLSLDGITNATAAPKPAARPPADDKPQGFTIGATVLEHSPAAVTVEDANGERHVLTGKSWHPSASPGESVAITMTEDGWRLWHTHQEEKPSE